LQFFEDKAEDEQKELTTEMEIQSKVDSLLSYKRKEPKKYNNNPANMR